jgi:hypothetical protein
MNKIESDMNYLSEEAQDNVRSLLAQIYHIFEGIEEFKNED